MEPTVQKVNELSAQVQAQTRVTCLWCNEPLRFVPGKGWVHMDGHAYKGKCSCVSVRHSYSHDHFDNLICYTWRDDHVAMPNRKREV